ncbi:unnamed protein product [Adineta steineri]|uniref:Pentapeptide repeat-containing protein n=1 Tax=Adineta steineri TaxID=433720 RepID=A0A815N2G0_9BILA|nr:unnamed protein product [Adineta steineri]CAF1427564.1 unnamed protein product [Adineta steineri]
MESAANNIEKKRIATVHEQQWKFSTPTLPKIIIKACSTAIVPLMIGTLTLILAYQQHYQGIQNRQTDLHIAKTQEQLENEKRQQDLHIAEAIQQDTVLNAYLEKVSQLLLSQQFNLSSNTLKSIIRPKTLTTIRQLDATRKTLLVKFLYESSLLMRHETVDSRCKSSDKQDVDLQDANLNGIIMGSQNIETERVNLFRISLSKVTLINSSFTFCFLNCANFERSILDGSSFRNSHLRDTNLIRTSLAYTDFTGATLSGSNLDLANLTGSNILDSQLVDVDSSDRTILPNGTIAHMYNLVHNGDARNCTLNHWSIYPVDSVKVVPASDNRIDGCRFQVISNRSDKIHMVQKINDEMMDNLINKGRQNFEVRFRIGGNTTGTQSWTDSFPIFLNVSERTSKEHFLEIAFSTRPSSYSINKMATFHQYSLITEYFMWNNDRSLELVVSFPNGTLFDNIELYLERDIILKDRYA